MTDSLLIQKKSDLLPGQDFYFLREKGIEFIQKLSGKIWTDHNAHDPGITSLEILAYALTDLGYRTDFEIKDLLVAPDGSTDAPEVSSFFPAHEILPVCPITINDFRKLLLKVEGVRNAWLDPMMDPGEKGNYKESEIPVYADCYAGHLSYEPKNGLGKNNPRVWLSGLYKVLLELEVNDVFGSLNESKLTYRALRGQLKGVTVSIDIKDEAFKNGELDFDRTLEGIKMLSLTREDGRYKARIRLKFTSGPNIVFNNAEIKVINDKPRSNEPAIDITNAKLKQVVEDSGADGLLNLFLEKQLAIKAALDKVCCVLDAHRNLCEDWLSIETVKPEHISICMDIELKNEADIEVVQANAILAIEEYFNPSIKYYTLQELLDEGLCPDDIFNGPYIDKGFTCGGEKVFTKAGFVKDGELEASSLRRFIYTSDIINILMDFEEIIAVKNLLLRKYDDNGKPIGNSEKWCMAVTPGRQPVLYTEGSKFLFYKNEIPYTAKLTELQKTIDYLRVMAKKEAYVDPGQTLALPLGKYRSPDAFYSIQHDFPDTYGIGGAGLPNTVPQERVAQARQFKAYLLFFDQLLADYLAQLANVRKIFSLDKAVSQTYFSQYLSEIAGVSDAFEDEFYIDKTILQNDASRSLLTEDEVLFQERRNRVLDHLLARFAEQFTDYALMLLSLDGDQIKAGEELIEDKTDFLRDYPVLSRSRAKAFNYRPQNPADIWDTENVSGLERKVSRLMGISDFSRRDLHCAALQAMFIKPRKEGSEFKLVIQKPGAGFIFSSVERFASRALAKKAAKDIFPAVRQEGSYSIQPDGGTGKLFFTISNGFVSLQSERQYEGQSDAVNAVREVIGFYDELLLNDEACNNEGFHLIEHILLRPFTDQDHLYETCIDAGCKMCGEEDPYSFRASVILPYWPKRFNDIAFRNFFEKTLREETPAHIHLKICWIGNDQMAEFEKRYRAWLEVKSVKDFDQAALTLRLNELLEILQQLKTIYPAATLHDCEEDGGDNPLRLGNTNLGIF
ncbi:MAG TPA: hypothetical protein ENJ95_01025 [Bacteroidetes bacterium]|nr:hypothetical protein [Bacteroidota bacterium]